MVLPPLQGTNTSHNDISSTQTYKTKHEHRFVLPNSVEVHSVTIQSYKKLDTRVKQQQQNKVTSSKNFVAVLSNDGNHIIDLTDETAQNEKQITASNNCEIERNKDCPTDGVPNQIETAQVEASKIIQLQPDKWLEVKRYKRT